MEVTEYQKQEIIRNSSKKKSYNYFGILEEHIINQA